MNTNSLKKLLKFCLGALAIAALAACHEDKETTLKISSAASLTDVVSKLAADYRLEYGQACRLNFASSSVCAKQIAQGMEADLFLSANPKWSQYLVDKQLADPQTCQVLLHNSLVVIVPQDSDLLIESLADLERCQKIACGDVSHVPAGVYAKKSLQKAGLYQKLKSKIVGAVDVRAAMSMVENGSVDCGIVYRTDALASKQTKLAYQIPARFTPPITYTICLLDSSQSKLLKFFRSAAAKKVYQDYGFSPAF